MRWPFRHRQHGPSEDAQHAADHASRALIDAQHLSGRVDRMTEELAETRRRNHFAAAVAAAMRGA